MNERQNAYNRISYRNHAAERNAATRAYWETHKQQHKDSVNARHLEVKTEVLSRYGKDGKLRCCWDACEVVDVDMLSLDHVADNGAEHRRRDGQKAQGAGLYRTLIKAHFPAGYQTLCLNHQFKKQLLRGRDGGNTPCE